MTEFFEQRKIFLRNVFLSPIETELQLQLLDSLRVSKNLLYHSLLCTQSATSVSMLHDPF